MNDEDNQLYPPQAQHIEMPAALIAVSVLLSLLSLIVFAYIVTNNERAFNEAHAEEGAK